MTQTATPDLRRLNAPFHWAGWLALLLALLLLSACGGGSGGGGGVEAPSITAQPTSASVVAGASATFSVTASGEGLSYQWQRSTDAAITWADIAGATAATYVIASVDAALDGYAYRAVVSGAGSSVTTSAVKLTVAPAPEPPVITVQPASQTALAGASAAFSVTATGTALTYRWQSGPDGSTWTDVAAATDATLTLSAVTEADSGKHLRVVVGNLTGSATSDGAATLTVTPAPPASTLPVITAQPTAASVVAPQVATFTVVASGTPAPSYQWQQSTDNGSTYADIVGATGASYVTPATAASDNGKFFKARVSNSAGTVPSDGVKLTVATVGQGPQFGTQPLSQDLLDSATAMATFTVAASGVPTPTYQWQIGSVYSATFANINGATSASYTTPALGLGDSGNLYRAIASNSFGSATSTSALVTVHHVGGIGIQAAGVAVDSTGNLFIGIDGNLSVSLGLPSSFSGIERFSSTGALSVVAGGPAGIGYVDGLSTFARFARPGGLAIDGSGNVYVPDAGAIRKVTPSGLVSTVAGSITQGFVDGTGALASFFGAAGVAVDGSGTLFVADSGNNAIRSVTPAGVVGTLAGPHPATLGFVDGTGAAARFSGPRGIAMDGGGNLYVADYGNNAIRKVSPAGVVTTLAGSAPVGPGGTTAGFADGTGSAARFNRPWGVAVDSAGNVYVSDRGNFAVRKITPAGVVSTLAGGTSGYVDGVGAAARFVTLQGIAVDASGNVYVTDSSYVPNGLLYNAVRKISPSGVVSTVTN